MFKESTLGRRSSLHRDQRSTFPFCSRKDSILKKQKFARDGLGRDKEKEKTFLKQWNTTSAVLFIGLEGHLTQSNSTTSSQIQLGGLFGEKWQEQKDSFGWLTIQDTSFNCIRQVASWFMPLSSHGFRKCLEESGLKQLKRGDKWESSWIDIGRSLMEIRETKLCSSERIWRRKM